MSRRSLEQRQGHQGPRAHVLRDVNTDQAAQGTGENRMVSPDIHAHGPDACPEAHRGTSCPKVPNLPAGRRVPSTNPEMLNNSEIRMAQCSKRRRRREPRSAAADPAICAGLFGTLMFGILSLFRVSSFVFRACDPGNQALSGHEALDAIAPSGLQLDVDATAPAA